MKKYIFSVLPVVFALCFMAGGAVQAAGTEAEQAGTKGLGLVMELITLVVVGGILYSLWVGMRGFGGLIGSALKRVGVGVFLISLTTIDAVIEGISGYGSETILGDGELHEFAHQLIPLAGFIILAVGLMKITKFVQSSKA